MATFNKTWPALTFLIVYALSATSYVESVDKMLAKCVELLDDKCGKELLLSTFFNDGNATVDCCMQVAEMGKPCHEKLVQNTLSSSPRYQKKAKEILERSRSNYNQCLSTVRASTPHNTSCPPLTNLTCGEEIFSRVFQSKGELSNDCCGVLVGIGKDCHDRLVGEHIAKAKLGPKKKVILAGSTSVWNWCTYIAPSLPYVKGCEAKLDRKCGLEIGLGIFLGKGRVTKECCSKLVKSGPECHDRWVKTNMARPNFVKISKTILERSTKIWKKCISYV